MRRSPHEESQGEPKWKELGDDVLNAINTIRQYKLHQAAIRLGMRSARDFHPDILAASQIVENELGRLQHERRVAEAERNRRLAGQNR